MPVNYYRRGTYAENVVRRELEEKGYFVVRSSLSRGPADLMAAKPDRLLLVQVKRGHAGLKPDERERLFRSAMLAGGEAVLALYRRYHPPLYFVYIGTGANDREEVEL